MIDLRDDPEVCALYREPPERFVAARHALARARKGAGDAAEAGAIEQLRKPTLPAWALDQLADRDPEGVDALIEAGAELRAAQRAATSSTEHAGRLREAMTARRAIVTRLVEGAAAVLVDAGRTPDPHLGDIAATLEAASVNAEVAAQLRTGTFDRPAHEAGGFGDVFGLRAVPDLAREAEDEQEGPTSISAPTPGGPGADERRERAERNAEANRLRRDRQATERRARTARETADRLAAEAEAMGARLGIVEEKRREAERVARSAEDDASRAATAHDRARAQLEALDG